MILEFHDDGGWWVRTIRDDGTESNSRGTVEVSADGRLAIGSRSKSFALRAAARAANIVLICMARDTSDGAVNAIVNAALITTMAQKTPVHIVTWEGEVI